MFTPGPNPAVISWCSTACLRLVPTQLSLVLLGADARMRLLMNAGTFITHTLQQCAAKAQERSLHIHCSSAQPRRRPRSLHRHCSSAQPRRRNVNYTYTEATRSQGAVTFITHTLQQCAAKAQDRSLHILCSSAQPRRKNVYYSYSAAVRSECAGTFITHILQQRAAKAQERSVHVLCSRAQRRRRNVHYTDTAAVRSEGAGHARSRLVSNGPCVI